MGITNSCKLFQVQVPQLRLFGTFIPNNANAGGSTICIRKSLLPDGTSVTHVVTCHGRGHIVSIQSGDCVLVVRHLALRSLRER